MHTTIGFCEAAATAKIDDPIAGVADQHARVEDDDIYIGKYNKIVALAATGYNMGYAKIASPSLRRVFNPFIQPIMSRTAEAIESWQPVDYSRNPIPLATNEALNAFGYVTEIAGTQYSIVGVNLSTGPLTPVTGEIHTLVITDLTPDNTTAAVWNNNQLTLGVDLPVGRYQVVGAQCVTSYGGLFRLVPVGEDFRPGGVMHDDTKTNQLMAQRLGNWGVWCEFDQLTPPSLDILPYTTTGWYRLTLDLIKVG